MHAVVTALAHSVITDPNGVADVQHLTAAQMGALHAIYTNANAVSKSYPGFFDDYKSLGGKYKII